MPKRNYEGSTIQAPAKVAKRVYKKTVKKASMPRVSSAIKAFVQRQIALNEEEKVAINQYPASPIAETTVLSPTPLIHYLLPR